MISKSQTHLPRPEQELLGAFISTGAEPPSTHGVQNPAHRLLAPDPLRPRKRQFGGISGNPSPVKRLRLTHTSDLRRSARIRERQYSLGSQRPIPTAPSIPSCESQKVREEVKPSLPAPTVEGQEQVSPDNEHQPKRAQLTQKNLALFNKIPRKKPASATVPSESATESSKAVSSTSHGFADQAYKNGILDAHYSIPPTNIEDICERHARSRATASPSEFEYRRYANNVAIAPNESTMVVIGSQLLKQYDDDKYNKVYNQSFTGFPQDVGFNNSLSAPQPDFTEGLQKHEYSPFPLTDVNGAVLYKDDPFSLALPHLAGEWKGRGKDMEEARLQSSYVGAALVYARNQALSYIGEPDPPGHAEVTTFALDGININFFAHYAAPSKNGKLEYHQYKYASANVKDSYQGHKDGRRGLRNQQDHARKQSYVLRDRLKEHWEQSSLRPVAEDA
ncbi:hypothetical protein B0T21DRAFT_207365 [Apiosordaria backusii]|uniref:Uncharacterized protein n=1 Tax=Apiosordaria backusii TaxID=314023 RepID=A0AA40B7K8_9PEZI|nr:hypothetical protein B0T21DRAFT_207365 [Apiosordaria backusii]